MVDQTIFAVLDDEYRLVRTNAPGLLVQKQATGSVVIDLANIVRPGQSMYALATVTHFGIQDQNLKDNVHIYAYLDNKIEVRTGDSNGSPASRGFTIAIHRTER